ncbi:MAG: hypothetical protein M3020_24215 [Myxococcota bacterium]|nr:hypothetical protein [Myxococcota bacterium]
MTIRHRLAAGLRQLAQRLDPPRHHCDLEEADRRVLEAWAHVDAGRIRRRRGESARDFGRRVARGDYVVVDNLIDFDTERARRAQTPRKAATRW